MCRTALASVADHSHIPSVMITQSDCHDSPNERNETLVLPKVQELLQWKELEESYRVRLRQTESLLALDINTNEECVLQDQIRRSNWELLSIMGRQSTEALIIRRCHDQPRVLSAVYNPQFREDLKFRRKLVERDALTTQYSKQGDKLKSLSWENVLREQHISELMQENDGLRKPSENTCSSSPHVEETDEITRNSIELQKLKEKRRVLGNLLMGIILERGIDWTENDEYRRCIESAEGSWIDEIWGEVTR
ncbi:uncharacterized protein SPPG_01066 [Spizellomyces punctatus DAOM BR117]|uniref:Centromere protein H C-terminal domain-containing protein n=1 Tax=Spizellomyces punctatus (strain DAOM BR117) TaxID=645134 RepID=A0A0L0HRS8_SPIPD|nr:uncharacterized protein SPPG_01066 [Spizellomyces punctatus DAOM BR117]KND03590.1 hypothetical protein SPPG_01066 [Spizellomyces punctatus DAOM BR117]|eukprot:XP_016611629.1 hypothetical protein SPPG_01066 [Spizellomyces punctatus DAOM BR117]